MIFVIARSYEEAKFYCTMVADPPLERRDVTIISTSSASAVKGRHVADDDTIVFYGDYSNGRNYLEVAEGFLPCIIGNPKTIDVWGHTKTVGRWRGDDGIKRGPLVL